MRLIASIFIATVLCSPAYAEESFDGVASVFRHKGVTYIELTTQEHGRIVGIIPRTSAVEFPDVLFADGKLVQMNGPVQDGGRSREIVLTHRRQLSIG